jgi:NAD(P)-dependent dehydrogenase (short-subunit alcohol dehydrogenase family)
MESIGRTFHAFLDGGHTTLVPGYAASKGAVAQLTRSLAITYAADTMAVHFFRSPAAAFVTGTILPVDGGYPTA